MFEFLRKKNNEDRIIKSVIGSLKQDTLLKVFYGETEEAGRLVKALRKKLYPDKASVAIEQYKTIVFFYIHVWTRTHGGLRPEFSRKKYICKAMKERFGQFPPSMVDHAIDVCLDFIFRNEPEIKQKVLESPDSGLKDSKEQQEALANIMKLFMAQDAVNKQAGETAKGNDGVENKYLDDPDYGLVQEKPVFVNGFGAHRNYLNSLRTESGGNLEYSRLGSMSVDGIVGRVDLYRLTPKDGTGEIMLYLCLYGSSNSTTAPKGLKLVSTQPGDSSSNTEVEAPFVFF